MIDEEVADDVPLRFFKNDVDEADDDEDDAVDDGDDDIIVLDFDNELMLLYNPKRLTQPLVLDLVHTGSLRSDWIVRERKRNNQ